MRRKTKGSHGGTILQARILSRIYLHTYVRATLSGPHPCARRHSGRSLRSFSPALQSSGLITRGLRSKPWRSPRYLSCIVTAVLMQLLKGHTINFCPSCQRARGCPLDHPASARMPSSASTLVQSPKLNAHDNQDVAENPQLLVRSKMSASATLQRLASDGVNGFRNGVTSSKHRHQAVVKMSSTKIDRDWVCPRLHPTLASLLTTMNQWLVRSHTFWGEFGLGGMNVCQLGFRSIAPLKATSCLRYNISCNVRTSTYVTRSIQSPR